MATDNSYPRRVSDPEASGIPEFADDETSGGDDLDPGRWGDGPEPATIPSDRDDGPRALDDFGTTAEEQRQGEPLDQRLTREEPDVTPEPVPFGMLEDGPVEPENDSQVSTFERLGEDAITHGEVGRLVDAGDDGATNQERDSVAYDAGFAGGAPTAEEAAIHEVRPGEER